MKLWVPSFAWKCGQHNRSGPSALGHCGHPGPPCWAVTRLYLRPWPQGLLRQALEFPGLRKRPKHRDCWLQVLACLRTQAQPDRRLEVDVGCGCSHSARCRLTGSAVASCFRARAPCRTLSANEQTAITTFLPIPCPGRATQVVVSGQFHWRPGCFSQLLRKPFYLDFTHTKAERR